MSDLQQQTSNLSNKLLEFTSNIVDQVSAECVGLDATILFGKFKGRRGRITLVSFERHRGLIFLVQPYRLAGSPDNGQHPDLLWDDPEARTYRTLNQFIIVEGSHGDPV